MNYILPTPYPTVKICSHFFPKGLLKAEEHSWSLAELVHAVVLLTHYHSLASFTFGCGISPEIHCDGGHTFRPPSVSNYCICDITNGNHSVDEMQVNSAGNVSVSICYRTILRLITGIAVVLFFHLTSQKVQSKQIRSPYLFIQQVFIECLQMLSTSLVLRDIQDCKTVQEVTFE